MGFILWELLKIEGKSIADLFRSAKPRTRKVIGIGLPVLAGLGLYALAKSCSSSGPELPSQYPMTSLTGRLTTVNLVIEDPDKRLANQDDSYFRMIHDRGTNDFSIKLLDKRGNQVLSGYDLPDAEKARLADLYKFGIQPKMDKGEDLTVRCKYPSNGSLDVSVVIPVAENKIR